MKTKILLMLAAAVVLLPLSGLKAQFNFIENYGMPTSDNGNTAQVCANGDFITAGMSHNGLEWDMYVVRTTNAGVIVWAQLYPIIGHEQIYSIKETANGDFVMTGHCLINGTTLDVIVHRINSSGGVLWTRKFDHTRSEEGKDIIEIPSGVPGAGNLVVVGYSEPAWGNRDYYAAMLTPAGGLLWQKQYPGIALAPGDEVAHSVLYNTVTGNLSVLGYSNSFTPSAPSYAATLLDIDPVTGTMVGLTSYDIPVGNEIANDEYGYKLIQLAGVSWATAPGDLMLLCRTDYGLNPDNIWVIHTSPTGVAFPATSAIYDFYANDDPASIVEDTSQGPPWYMPSITFSHIRRFAGKVYFICLTNFIPGFLTNWTRQYDQVVYLPADLTHSLDIAADQGYVQVSRSNTTTVGGTDFHLIKTDVSGQVKGVLGANCYTNIPVRGDASIHSVEWGPLPDSSLHDSLNLTTINVPLGLQIISCFSQNASQKSAPAGEESSAGTTLYPNPSDGQVILQFNIAEAADVTISLYNSTGQLLMTGSTRVAKGIQEQTLDLSTYAPGLYLLQVQKGGQTEYHKVMIEK